MSDVDALSELVDHLALDSPKAEIDGVDPLTISNVLSDAGSSYSHGVMDIQNEIDAILKAISSCSTTIYEERRHTVPASNDQSGQSVTGDLVAGLDSAIASIAKRVGAVTTQIHGQLKGSQDLQGDLSELEIEWDRLRASHAILKEEQKEDGWLSRFRTTAEQAEAMMDPLQKSLMDCLAYLDGSAQNGPMEDHSLQELAKSHESMKATYVPSVTKILKMISKSVNESPTQNGEAIRRQVSKSPMLPVLTVRLGEMQTRWTKLAKELQKLDQRLRIALDRPSGSKPPSLGDVEVLTDATSSLASPTDDYFGAGSTSRGSSSHRSSHSSDYSKLQAKSSSHNLSSKTPAAPTRTVRRQPSNISAGTASDKPKWDIGTRPPPVPPVPTMYQTASSRRSSIYDAKPPAPRSPTPSSSSIASGSRILIQGSRIPVRSPPPNKTRSEMMVPSAQPAQRGLPDTRQSLDPHSYLTPTRPRQSMPFSLPRSTTPSFAPRSASYGATLAPNPGPRSEPPRRNLARNPPSSFRSTTPTPSRPSSRLSASSMLISAAALHPFEPSKFDMLDQEVSKILNQAGFNLFVARLDPPLKRGQMKRDDEEWKGEFVFGAGERSSSVKLLKLVGRAMDGGQVSIKCMCRVAGAWHELSAVLRDRLSRAPAQMSP